MNEKTEKSAVHTEANQHANLEELMMIRDGGLNKLEHVHQCSFCQARLEDVCVAAKSVQETLIFNAERPVPESAWRAIEAQLRERGITEQLSDPDGDVLQQNAVSEAHMASQNVTKPRFWTSINTAIYSLALAIAFTGSVSLYTFNGQQQAQVEARELQASIQSLMDNSRGLERVLQQVADQRVGSGLSVADQSSIDRLQWRLMMVDQQIHESESSDDVTYEQIKALWGERIEALTQLNELYYANHVTAREGTF